MKAYGIWNTTTQRWATDSEGIIVVFPTLGAAVAQHRETADRMGAHPAAIDAEVAEIGDDGLPVEVEDYSLESSDRRLLKVVPQPDFIESSGRWRWPLPESARFPGCCEVVVTASREWWEYAPPEAKPHPMAEGVRLRDGVWYWAIPSTNGRPVEVET